MQKSLSSSLLLALFALLGMGLVQVYSSSYIVSHETLGDGLFFFRRQLLFTGIGLILLVGFSQLRTQLVEKYGWIFWVLASIGVVLTLVPGFGVKVGGAYRWIPVSFGMRFEPSELLKASYGLYFASLVDRENNFLKKVPVPLLVLILFAPLFLLLKQPDFGSFIIIISIAVSLLFILGLKWRYLIAGFLVIIPTLSYLIMQKGYRKARFTAFLDPWADPEQKGFQVIQSMLSFSNGGLTGAGLGQGQGKLFFLPESHTDFTLAIFGEEMGYVGFVLLMGLYGFVVLRGFQIGLKAKTQFQRAFAVGLSVHFALSVIINVGVVFGLLPTKGLTLPFLSYGGSHIITFCIMYGILISIENSLPENFQSTQKKQSFSTHRV